MHDHHITQMVRKLTPVLKNPAQAQVILKRYWQTRMALVWEEMDVHRAANERERVLTPKEAVQILETLHQQHNKQLGIRWSDLWDHLDLFKPGRKMTRAELNRFVAKDIITIAK